jgi:L-iditol 2-dehydrogenase
MKVGMWYNNRDIRIEEVPRPRPGPGEALIQIMSCGICGSDTVEWYRLPRAPLVLGHEIGARVVETGESVDKVKPGDRVVVAPKVPCMKCHYCEKGHHPVCPNVKERLPGGFAEYVVVPEPLMENGVYLLPENIDDDRSTFIEPLACVVRAQRLAGVTGNRSVMVIGCGGAGLLHVKLAKARSCRVIASDINRKRLEYARKLGADMVIGPEENLSQRLAARNVKKPDIVILCTSAMPAIQQAWEAVDKGGVILFYAVPGPDRQVVVPVNDFWTKEVNIVTSYYCSPADMVEALSLLERQTITVDDMITHRLPLAELARGFQLVMDGTESLKVIIKPNG